MKILFCFLFIYNNNVFHWRKNLKSFTEMEECSEDEFFRRETLINNDLTRLRTSGLLWVLSLSGLENLVLPLCYLRITFSELAGRISLIINAVLPNWQLFLTIVKQLSKDNPFSHRQLSQFGRTYAFYLQRWCPSERPLLTNGKRPKQSNWSFEVFIKQTRLCISVQFSRQILSVYNETGVSCPRRGICTLIFRLVPTLLYLLSTPTLWHP